MAAFEGIIVIEEECKTEDELNGASNEMEFRVMMIWWAILGVKLFLVMRQVALFLDSLSSCCRLTMCCV